MKNKCEVDIEYINSVQKQGSFKRLCFLIRKAQIPWWMIFPTFFFETLRATVTVWFPVYQQKITGGDFSAKTITFACLILIFQEVFIYAVLPAFSQYQYQVAPRNLKRVVIDKVFSLPSRFFDKYKSRELVSRITRDASGVVQFLLFPTSIYGIVLSFYLMIKELFTYDASLAWFVMAFIPLTALLKIVVANIQYKITIGLRTSEAKLIHYLADSLRNIPVIKIFVKEDKEKIKGERLIHNIFKKMLSINVVSIISLFISNGITLSVRIGVIIIGIKLTKEGIITIPQWITFYMFSESALITSSRFFEQYAVVRDAQASLNFMSGILSVKSEDTSGEKVKELGDIEFNNVTFAYDEKPVIKDVSFKIPFGSRVAIVGSSGSGKTTILSLIERLYKVDKGLITMNGVDINEFDANDYRKKFTYVTQGFVLYSGTIMDNLKYGVNREVTDEEVINACKIANIHNFIDSLKDKYNTKVLEGASNFSGGERQRLALANAFLCNNEFMIFDEATSNLDVLSEHIVCEAIENVSKNKTVIAIAHKLSTVKDYDTIIVMDKGQVVNVGKHDELISTCDVYKELVENSSRKVSVYNE